MKEETKLSKEDMDYILDQLKQSQNETASTITMQPGRAFKRQQSVQVVKPRAWMIGLGVIIIIAGLVAWFGFFQNGATLTSTTVVERVEKLSMLVTAKGHYKTVIEEKDKKLFGKDIKWEFPGSKRVLLLVYPGEVTAGIDLKKLTKDDITVDSKKKTIHVTLPPATIIQSSIDLGKTQNYSYDGLFRSEGNLDKGNELGDIAKQKMEDEAKSTGLLTEAEKNAQIALKEIFELEGYTVTVTFK